MKVINFRFDKDFKNSEWIPACPEGSQRIVESTDMSQAN